MAFAALAFWAYVKRPRPARGKLSLNAHYELMNLRDRYSKRMLNSLFFLFAFLALKVFGTFIAEADFAVARGLLETLALNLGYIAAIVFLIGKNAILADWTNTILSDARNRRMTGRLTVFLIVMSALYWTIVLAMFRAFNTTNIVTEYIAIGIYVIIALVFNLTRRKKITYQNIKINKRRAIIVPVLVAALCGYTFLQKDVWLTQPYINTVANINERQDSIAYDEEKDGTGV